MVVEDRLADVLSDFARALVTDDPVQASLDRLVRHAVEVLPVDGAGLALIASSHEPEVLAGSDASAVRFERLQATLREGPCVAAVESEEAVVIPDLRVEHRFPAFTAAALAAGLRAVFTFPLRNEGRCLGALDLYRDREGELSERDLEVGQTLADVATGYLRNEEARAARHDFVAAIGHELRTPMSSIAGFLELLQDGTVGRLTEEQQRFLEVMRRNSDRLVAFAEDLLTLSRLESGRLSHSSEEVDLGALTTRVVARLEALTTSSGHEVSVAIADRPVVVRGDAEQLESVISNLVSNALKFSVEGGAVRCRVATLGDRAILEVSDDGLGIQEFEQRDLFKQFFRTSVAHEHAIQGAGLGLTIVDAVVREHGGEVRVASQPDRGSTFTVTLPLVGNDSGGAHSGPADEDGPRGRRAGAAPNG